MLEATWANVREHAADRPDYWGSRGRGFKSRRPDQEEGPLTGRSFLVNGPLLMVIPLRP